MSPVRLQVLVQTVLKQAVFAVFLNTTYLCSQSIILDHRSDNTYVYDLRNLIAQAGLDISLINEFYLVNGPGFFTGIRSGVIMSKAIYQLKKPKMFLVSTFSYLSAHLNPRPEHYGILICGSQREGYYQEYRAQEKGEATIISYKTAQEKAKQFSIYTDHMEYSIQWGLRYLPAQAVFPLEYKEIKEISDLLPNYLRQEDDLFRS